MTLQLHLLILPAIMFISLAVTLGARRKFRVSWASREGKRDPNYSYINYTKDSLPSFWISGIGVGLTSLLALAVLIALLPYSPRYWVLTETSGTISTLSNRFVAGSGDVSGQTYTLTLEGDPTPRVVDDSRVLGLKVGESVDLTCSIEWVYGGADRSNCYLRSF